MCILQAPRVPCPHCVLLNSVNFPCLFIQPKPAEYLPDPGTHNKKARQGPCPWGVYFLGVEREEKKPKLISKTFLIVMSVGKKQSRVTETAMGGGYFRQGELIWEGLSEGRTEE